MVGFLYVADRAAPTWGAPHLALTDRLDGYNYASFFALPVRVSISPLSANVRVPLVHGAGGVFLRFPTSGLVILA